MSKKTTCIGCGTPESTVGGMLCSECRSKAFGELEFPELTSVQFRRVIGKPLNQATGESK